MGLSPSVCCFAASRWRFFCLQVAEELQSYCKGAAKTLQNRCKHIAELLQLFCSATANMDAVPLQNGCSDAVARTPESKSRLRAPVGKRRKRRFFLSAGG